MAAPLLAPLASLLPVVKILALGSLKFVGVGIGAAVAPVVTANFLVGLSAETPLNYAKFRQQKGHFSLEELARIEEANALIANSINIPSQHLTRGEAQEFLKGVLLNTLVAMKLSITSMPARMLRMTRSLIALCKKPFSNLDK